mgnify:CR=1 FL=1
MTSNTRSKTVFVSAGEASGDAHAARMIKELKKLDNHLTFVGMGGEKMRQAGVKILTDIDKMAVVGLGEFFLPVVVYGAAISIFGMVSLLNYMIRKDNSSLILLLGALLFILSDSMIALNKFYEAKALYGVAIMVTYILGQYLIFRYMLNRSVKDGPEEEN